MEVFKDSISHTDPLVAMVDEIYPHFHQITLNNKFMYRLAKKYLLNHSDYEEYITQEGQYFEKILHKVEKNYQSKIDIMRKLLIHITQLDYALNRKYPMCRLRPWKDYVASLHRLHPTDVFLTKLIVPFQDIYQTAYQLTISLPKTSPTLITFATKQEGGLEEKEEKEEVSSGMFDTSKWKKFSSQHCQYISKMKENLNSYYRHQFRVMHEMKEKVRRQKQKHISYKKEEWIHRNLEKTSSLFENNQHIHQRKERLLYFHQLYWKSYQYLYPSLTSFVQQIVRQWSNESLESESDTSDSSEI